MKYTIKDLADGVCSLKNDGTEEELQLVLDKAFPKDNTKGYSKEAVAYQAYGLLCGRMYSHEIDYILPMQSCSAFLEELNGVSENIKDTVSSSTREFETGSRRDDDSNKPLVNHLDPYLRLRFGYLLRQGANKYDKGNWKKGQPTETALESLHRHLAKFELNLQNGVEQDEDHLSAVLFNVMLILKNEEKEGIEANHYYGTLK